MMRTRFFVLAASTVFGASLFSLAPPSAFATASPFQEATDVQVVSAGAPVLPAGAADSGEVDVYVVLLKDEPVVSRARSDVRGAAARQHRAHLQGRQDAFVRDSGERLSRDAEVVHTYTHVLNGVAMRVSGKEAAELAKNPDVAAIVRSENHAPLTHSGPAWIGADAIWDDGSGAGLETSGEGVIVGIVDTGINPVHPSFAATDPTDGHVHANPYGSGNFVGVCDPAHPQHQPDFPCNDKLIGAYYFLNAWGAFPNEGAFDENGHGTHVASTAGGNRVEINFTGAEVVLSGVAPRANIISYRVCGGPQTLCNTADSAAAIDQAVIDGVHVLNFSIGGGTNPAVDLASQAFLRATEAGVFVAAAAGNTAGPGTVSHRGAWMTTVGSLTHDGMVAHPVSVTGPGQVPADLKGLAGLAGTGPAMTDIGVGARGPLPGTGQGQAVQRKRVHYAWAGHVDPANALGCQPFPAEAFDKMIALIQRGDCNFSDKVDNAEAAGAIAVVVYNNLPGRPIVMGALENTNIPSVMVSRDAGEALVAWADSHDDQFMSISGTAELAKDDEFADIMAGTSSQGPAGGLASVLKPDVAAPGVAILAAYVPDADSYAVIGGTSMASPHVAGSAGLLRALHPDWTPLEIKSALMLTGRFHGVRKDDAATPADAFNIGGGRVQVDRAARAGLVLDETRENFDAAYGGGDLTALNLASFANQSCDGSCSWTRTLRDTGSGAGTWAVTATSATAGLSVSADASLEVPAGGTAELAVSADSSGMTANSWGFFEVVLSDGNSATPDLRFSGAVFAPMPMQQGQYVATNNDEDATCAMPFANQGGYVDLAAFGIPINPNISGDTIGFITFNTGDPIFHHGAFFAEGMHFRDDGFAFFPHQGSIGPSGTPWVNRPIPTSTDPRNFVAPLWHDWVIIADPPQDRGVRLAVSGQTWVIADFRHVEPWPASGTAGSMTYQVAVRRSPALTPGAWDIIFAFNHVNTSSHLSNTTIGVENLFGDQGVQYAFNDAAKLSEIQNGHAICLRWVPD